jgi:pyruvate-formate lyase-activating enzyme
MDTEALWHVTVLCNFAKGYDKYARRYVKSGIPESTFPDRFFLLRQSELAVGVRKASGLRNRLALTGNRLIALKTHPHPDALHDNTRTGLGRYLERGWISLDGISWIDDDGALTSAVVEEVMAASLQLLQGALMPFAALRPRSLSALPIAKGCQAACPFCFSDASASAEQAQARLDLDAVRRLAARARAHGAERFVITGGGEPGLLRHAQLVALIRAGAEALGKAVLITNGHHLATQAPDGRAQSLADYAAAGLQVLAISRHHHDDATNAQLMRLSTDVASLAQTWRTDRARWPSLHMRLTCVLQRGAIDSLSAIEAYVSWAASLGVQEICFKELYVSTSVESVYHLHEANAWSHAHQVPLSLVLDFAALHGFAEVARLPWGAPVLRGVWGGAPMQIAAYTEPSLLWERLHGVARSWNLMADGRCLVSLEDRSSAIPLTEGAGVHELS